MKRQRIKNVGRSPATDYSEAFKRKVVAEYEQGFSTKDYLQQKYRIGGNSRILEWCRKYGKLNYPKTGITGRPMKDPQKQKIKELEKALKEAELKVKLYEKIIEIAERDEGIPITKKYGAMQSEKPHNPEQE